MKEEEGGAKREVKEEGALARQSYRLFFPIDAVDEWVTPPDRGVCFRAPNMTHPRPRASADELTAALKIMGKTKRGRPKRAAAEAATSAMDQHAATERALVKYYSVPAGSSGSGFGV